jgi:hypothetical protein
MGNLPKRVDELCYGLNQAFQKLQLSGCLFFDNCAAMIAVETQQKLARLSNLAQNTLPYLAIPERKAAVLLWPDRKRLPPMLEKVADLTLDPLNEATLAWIEMEYNRKVHSETGQAPLHRAPKNPALSAPEPISPQPWPG